MFDGGRPHQLIDGRFYNLLLLLNALVIVEQYNLYSPANKASFELLKIQVWNQ